MRQMEGKKSSSAEAKRSFSCGLGPGAWGPGQAGSYVPSGLGQDFLTGQI